MRTLVESLSLERGGFVVKAGDCRLEADQVVVATGGPPLPFRPAFYFVAMPFQCNLASALIDGVGSDAEFIAQQVHAASGGQRGV